MKTPEFQLGQIVETSGVAEWLKADPNLMVDVAECLTRHSQGDWGDVCEEDKTENNLSVVSGYRILSAYHIAGRKIWIITEADRSSTCVLFPSEY